MYGPRYYYEAIGALALLSARGLLQLSALIGAALARVSVPPARAQLAGLAAMLLVTGLLTLDSARSFTPRQFDTFTDWYEINRDALDDVQAKGLTDAVVFVPRTKWTEYAPFFSENSPSLTSNVIYAIDRGPTRNRQVMRGFPDRTAWYYSGGQVLRLPTTELSSP
jgi:hypothetical protein